jgi:hypothetical protein
VQAFNVILFVSFMILTVIILLNLLIAMMVRTCFPFPPQRLLNGR